MIKRQSNSKNNKMLKMATTRKPSATKLKKKVKGKNNSTLPDIFNPRLGYFFIGLLGFSVLVFSYIWIDENYQTSEDLMPLRVVEIEGKLKEITREEILEKILKGKVTEFKNVLVGSDKVGFFSSDLELMEQRLESLPWVENVELRRVWPDKLHIKISEQKAIARWNEKSLINKFGKTFTPDSLVGLTTLPLLTGPEEELPQLLETFRDIQKRLESIDLQLAVLNLNRRYSWSLKLVNGITLQVGREHLLERVERFISLYPLLQRESKLPIAKVDLRYDTGLAVTRLETSELQASL